MNTEKSNKRRPAWIAVLGRLAVVIAIASLNKAPGAQAVISGSDGSDGALTVAVNAGPIIFDPGDTARWGRELDPDGDGVYNFTTITIGAGSTLRLQGDKVNRPVYWLASGDVVINGTLDLSGTSDSATNDLSVRRQVTVPGSGGYSGGAGGLTTTSVPPTPGEGPGGGSGGYACGWGAYVNLCGKGGTFSGNRYLIPLVGGSGGEGALANGLGGNTYWGGGAGGGAILISSSTMIAINGMIAANGGSGNCCPAGFSGSGSGGGIRLVAQTVSGNGHLNVAGGSSQGAAGNGGPGFVRLESFQISPSLIFDAGGVYVTRGSPVDSGSFRPASSIRVTAIDGKALLPSPTGSFVLPDVTISKNSPVNVSIQATGIPNGTVVTLQVYPQTPTDLTTVNLPTAQATLSGTLQSSTATATFTFPYGFSRGFVRASWTQ